MNIVHIAECIPLLYVYTIHLHSCMDSEIWKDFRQLLLMEKFSEVNTSNQRQFSTHVIIGFCI